MKKSNFIALILGTIGVIFFLHWACAWPPLQSGACSVRASSAA